MAGTHPQPLHRLFIQPAPVRRDAKIATDAIDNLADRLFDEGLVETIVEQPHAEVGEQILALVFRRLDLDHALEKLGRLTFARRAQGLLLFQHAGGVGLMFGGPVVFVAALELRQVLTELGAQRHGLTNGAGDARELQGEVADVGGVGVGVLGGGFGGLRADEAGEVHADVDEFSQRREVQLGPVAGRV